MLKSAKTVSLKKNLILFVLTASVANCALDSKFVFNEVASLLG
jgi:hypothetical protein